MEKVGANVDLTNRSAANVAFMIEAIKTKLRMASGSALSAERFDEANEEKYGDLKDIYELVESKDRFSVSEIDAIVAELGRLRKG